MLSLRRSMNTTSRHWPAIGPWLIRPMRSRTPMTLKPTAWCTARLARFSGKMPDWIVQISRGLSRFDQRGEQLPSDTASGGILGNVDGVLDDARVGAPVGDRRDGSPTDDKTGSVDGDEPMLGEPGGVERLPARWLDLERGVTGGDAGCVDLRDLRPVRCDQRADGDVRVSHARASSRSPQPATRPLPDLVPDGPDRLDAATSGIVQVPVLVLLPRVEGAGVPAAHRDHDVRRSHRRVREQLRLLGPDVDALLSHRLHRDGIDLIDGLGAGRQHVDPIPRQVLQVPGRHLGTAGVVHADEQDGRPDRVCHATSPRSAPRSASAPGVTR